MFRQVANPEKYVIIFLDIYFVMLSKFQISLNFDILKHPGSYLVMFTTFFINLF